MKLSNVIELIGKIGGIVLKVAIPFVIFAMILVPEGGEICTI